MFRIELESIPALEVSAFKLREAVSEHFEIEIEARSKDASIDLDKIVGAAATFAVTSEVAKANYRERSWPGICRRASLERAEPNGLSTYRLEVVPALWTLSQRRNYRVFRHRSAPEIVGELFGEWSIEARLSLCDAYPKLPYKVQYGESDLAFVSRILEEAGIAFTFEPDASGRAGLMIADRLTGNEPRSTPLRFADDVSALEHEEFATAVRLAERVRPGARVVTDFDPRRPRRPTRQMVEPVFGLAGRLEQHAYRPGAFLIEVETDGSTPVADEGGAARHDDRAGALVAKRELESMRADRFGIAYATNTLDSWPGRVLTLAGHGHPLLEAPLLVTQLVLEGSRGETWRAEARAVSASLAHRSSLRAGRPRARVQSATVVGHAPIDTDELGRVMVKFPWDPGAAESSTVRIRVNHGWAGAGFGFVAHPRVGEEVLVDFLEGDPEQPIVFGRVFNGTRPVVHTLPSGETRSAFVSNSTGDAGGNELHFEDAKGNESFEERAAKDGRRLVKRDDTSTTGNDRTKTIGGAEVESVEGARTQVTDGDRSETTARDRTTAVFDSLGELVKKSLNDVAESARLVAVGAAQHVVVDGDAREQAGTDTSLTVNGDRKESVGGTDSQGVVGALDSAVGSYVVNAAGENGTIHLFAGGSVVIESDGDASVIGAGGFVSADAGGVTITGTLVIINEGGAPGSLPAASPAAPDAAKPAAAPGSAQPDG